MPGADNQSHPLENVLDTVQKTKMLANRLRLTIIHQDNLNKERLDRNAAEQLQMVETVKKKYLMLEEEFEVVKEEVRVGEKRLNDTLQEYKKVVGESTALKAKETEILNQKLVLDEHLEIKKELKTKLNVFKLVTGVRFDFNMSDDILSGYVGVIGTSPSKSSVVPFEIKKNTSSGKLILREKINELCSELSQ